MKLCGRYDCGLVLPRARARLWGAVCASVGRRLQARNLGCDMVLAARLRMDLAVEEFRGDTRLR